ncbi:MAG: peptide chain release factor N(5)-glutamine methyltransferase [Ruminococcus sp.]|nr:peptide chain release factor N(5)-glutamine methyltransferase [Ruminococcus sp.]
MCIFQDMLGDRNPLFRPLETVPDDAEMRIRDLTARRCKGEPLQYLLGEWEFWGYPFRVGEGVLIPRPDTETLIEDVLGICRRNGLVSLKIADLCSGSGCIAVTLKKELPRAEVCAVELSEAALPYLRDNVKRNNADVRVIAADVLSEQTRQLVGETDIIVSNPPYLTADEMTELSPEVLREPSMALYGGADGLDFYRALTKMWKKSLKKGGFLCYEFGMDQHEAVGRILGENGFTDMKFSRDGGGIIRTVSARYIG